MTDTYLRSLGFLSTSFATRASQVAAWPHAWRYQYDHAAHDGTLLFIEHPLGIAACRLSTSEFPLAAPDVLASLGLHDRSGLEAAIKAFYAAHGGMGDAVTARPATSYRPFRRQP